jgi:hypothetical protein
MHPLEWSFFCRAQCKLLQRRQTVCCASSSLLLSSAMEQQALQRLQVLTHHLTLVSLTDVPA